MTKIFLTPMEMAELLGISKNKAYELLRSEGFPVVQIGRLKKIPIKALEEWITKNCNEGRV